MTTTEHLRELLAKATPGPWTAIGLYNKYLPDTIYASRDLFDGSDAPPLIQDENMNHRNCKCIVALINAAPALLDVVDCAHVYAHKGSRSGFQDLRKALAKLDEVKL